MAKRTKKKKINSTSAKIDFISVIAVLVFIEIVNCIVQVLYTIYVKKWMNFILKN